MHRFETKQRGFFEIKGKIWVNNSKKQDFELKYRCLYRNFKNCCTAVAPQFTAVKISFSNTAHNTAQQFYLCAVLFCTKFHSGGDGSSLMVIPNDFQKDKNYVDWSSNIPKPAEYFIDKTDKKIHQFFE